MVQMIYVPGVIEDALHFMEKTMTFGGAPA